ncbi:cilia- and flagella-associated protein 100-like isoform X2 [Corticium candelabrum]|uniref:cilia- and flagella-associated protein 100-like isoform X2 n=1 Tax=Corticium candelabrum TaxID=121492 RepID=UPI002E25D4D3|nr:cilia- and flagella-associated protein 100-like isoform X2 [Corticium candelabrum]
MSEVERASFRTEDSRPMSQTSGRKSVDEQSHVSGHVTLPSATLLHSASQATSTAQAPTQHVAKQTKRRENPFRVPPENDIFNLRDQEKMKEKEERVRQRRLKVHEKTTYTQRLNARSGALRRAVYSPTFTDDVQQKKKEAAVTRADPSFVISTTKDRHVEKESLADYIAKKREMFLVEYALGVKRDEMKKLEQLAQEEEAKLEQAEHHLEEDAIMFDEFLKENDKNSVEAIKQAEQETKLKLEKVAEIKKLNAQITSLKSEISKNEEQLQEYRHYKMFLERLAPQEWRHEQEAKRAQRRKDLQVAKKIIERTSSSQLDRTSSRVSIGSKEKKLMRNLSSLSLKKIAVKRTQSVAQDTDSQVSIASLAVSESEEETEDEDCELYFSDPQQLLDIFTELEEQNLSLIQNSQETEEALEDMRQTIKQTEEKMNWETQALQNQIEMLEAAIRRESERATELELKAKMFNFGEFKAEDQEQMLDALNKKVGEVYRNCIGENEANIMTLHMLTSIENRLEELFEQLDVLPSEKVEAAEKAKEKERRHHAMELKKEEERLMSEERARRALARARAEPKKKTGKKLMVRSEPPQAKKREQSMSEAMDKEQEEMQYYFS